jgi:ubiquinone/menaquinone biosynthesis C-methylase UbiE
MKDIQRLLWSQGDYPAIARETLPAAQAVVAALEVDDGMSLLDIAAGNGNVAALAAKRGARVVACDLTPKMIELGRARCQSEGLEVDWLEADAEALPFPDDSFDRAASVFGAMFAPRPQTTAAEMLRVVTPGGTVGMANWTPDGFIGELVRTVAAHVPAAPGGFPPPTEWGEESTAVRRLAAVAADVETKHNALAITHESPDALITHYERSNGPIVAARMLLRDRYPELVRDIRELIDEFNHASDGSVLIEAEYLLAIAHVA